MQGAKSPRPIGKKKALDDHRKRLQLEYWNKKRDMRMVQTIQAMTRHTKATEKATETLKFSAYQNAISARVGHYLMLGQNRRALDLLDRTENSIDRFLEQVEPVAQVAEEVNENKEDNQQEDEEQQEHQDLELYYGLVRDGDTAEGKDEEEELGSDDEGNQNKKQKAKTTLRTASI
jgi:hypothetical protein